MLRERERWIAGTMDELIGKGKDEVEAKNELEELKPHLDKKSRLGTEEAAPIEIPHAEF